LSPFFYFLEGAVFVETMTPRPDGNTLDFSDDDPEKAFRALTLSCLADVVIGIAVVFTYRGMPFFPQVHGDVLGGA
jgi:hypothetical protein